MIKCNKERNKKVKTTWKSAVVRMPRARPSTGLLCIHAELMRER